jgi:phage-related protein
MPATFPYQPSLDVVGTTTYSVRTAQFGDGYSQSVANGINNAVDSWPLTFSGSSAKIAAIKAFLDATQGYVSFYWTPPLGTQSLFRAGPYTVQPHGADSYTLTVTFTEVFS